MYVKFSFLFLGLSFCLWCSYFSIMYLNVDLLLFMLFSMKIHVWHNFRKFSNHLFEYCLFYISSVLSFLNAYKLYIRPSTTFMLLTSLLYYPCYLHAAFYLIFSDQYSSSIILSSATSNLFNLSIPFLISKLVLTCVL